VKLFTRLLLVASILYGTGAHWAALQSVAWASMKLKGQTDSCDVCHIVEKGTSVTQAPLALRPAPSVDMYFDHVVVSKAVLTASFPFVLPLISVSSLSALPAVPPPKLSLV